MHRAIAVSLVAGLHVFALTEAACGGGDAERSGATGLGAGVGHGAGAAQGAGGALGASSSASSAGGGGPGAGGSTTTTMHPECAAYAAQLCFCGSYQDCESLTQMTCNQNYDSCPQFYACAAAASCPDQIGCGTCIGN